MRRLRSPFVAVDVEKVEKKHKKFKKWIFPPLITLLLAILFGLVASITIIFAEPKLKKLFEHDVTRTPVSFPADNTSKNITSPNKPKSTITPTPITTPVVVEQHIPADINDYISMNDDILQVATNVSKSILNIKSKFTTEDLFGNSVIKTVHSTGVIMFNNSEELLVLVTLDKVKGAKNIKVIINDTVSVDAILQDYEAELNLGMLAVPIEEIQKVDLSQLEVAKLGQTYSVKEGDPIIALGSPNGHPGSIEYGMVTSKGNCSCVTDNEMDLFNTSIIDNKNSDGIIVDFKGQIIGIITQSLKEKGFEDLNTAIGITKLKQIITAMGNKTPRIYCGVKTDDMTSDTKAQYRVGNGIYVKEVVADSPAFKAGIQNGDIILQVDSTTILSSTNFFETINYYKSGDKADFKILRNIKGTDTTMNLSVTLSDKIK